MEPAKVISYELVAQSSEESWDGRVVHPHLTYKQLIDTYQRTSSDITKELIRDLILLPDGVPIDVKVSMLTLITIKPLCEGIYQNGSFTIIDRRNSRQLSIKSVIFIKPTLSKLGTLQISPLGRTSMEGLVEVTGKLLVPNIAELVSENEILDLYKKYKDHDWNICRFRGIWHLTRDNLNVKDIESINPITLENRWIILSFETVISLY